MNKYTPAPWKYEWSNDVGPDDDYYIEFFEVIAKDGTKIAQVEEEEDARLIAAAPELLGALMMLEIRGGLGLQTREYIRSLINKATGE